MTGRIQIATSLLSEMPCEDARYAQAMDYAVRWARKPDRGSFFERLTAVVRELPSDQMLGSLMADKYDMMLGYMDGGICGHYAFQGHDDGWHVFSVATTEEYHDSPLVVLRLTEGFIGQARQHGVRRFRLSGGNNKNMRSMLRVLAMRHDRYGLSVDEGSCWVELL